MAVRPLSRLRVTGHRSTSEADDVDTVVDLRDHTGPMRKKRNGRGPRRIGPDEFEDLGQLREIKFFGTPAFRRLWFSQALSSIGDWIGIIGIGVVAGTIAGPSGFSLVLAVRLGLAFFLASFAGVIVDRHNRKQIMVAAHLGRALVFCFVPFVDTLWGLLVASLVLELLTLMYSPAKEASVPNLVPKKFLPTANSLGVLAAYGTIPLAFGVFSGLTGISSVLFPDARIGSLALTETFLSLYFNAFMYVASALVIATLALPHVKRDRVRESGDSRTKTNLKEAFDGLRFVMSSPRVRGVVFGLAAGLIGGGSVVPLGLPYATDVLGAGGPGYGLLLTSMGSGMALGVVLVTLFFKKLPLDALFIGSIFGAGVTLGLAATMNGLGAAAISVGALGLCAGPVYVIGFTSLQTNVDDELRGRVFATFYTLTRVCILLAITTAPFVAQALNGLSNQVFDGSVFLGGSEILLPGVRLTLWLASAIILTAGAFVLVTFRRNRARQEANV